MVQHQQPSTALFSYFLKEARYFSWRTLQGVATYILGITVALAVIMQYKEALDDSVVNWKYLCLYLSLWFGLVSSFVGMGSFTGHGTYFLFAWVAAAGTLNSVNIIMGADLWLVKRDHHFMESGLALSTGFLYVGASVASIVIQNFVLQNKNFDLHVVAPLFMATNLFLDTISDLLIFERYKHWQPWEFIMMGIAFYLIFQGIFL